MTHPTAELARKILTQRQHDAYKLHSAGLSIRSIAIALDLSPSTIRDTLTRAHQKLEIAQRQEETQDASAPM